MATEERSLLVEVIGAAGRAAIWLGKAVVIALAGVLAAVMATFALALQVIGTLLKGLAEMATSALPVLLGLVPVLVRLLCLAFLLGATAWAGWLVGLAFGGDWLAWGLAALLAPTPLMTIYVPAPSWPRAVAAGTIALIGAGFVWGTPPLFSLSALFVVFTCLVTRRMAAPKPPRETEIFNDAESNQRDVA